MAEQTAHTEVPAEGHKAGFPPFQRETFASQLVWLVITFVVLYAVVAKFALPRVGGIFAARRERVDADMARARGASYERPSAARDSAPKRVVLKITPEKITSWDHTKLAGVY